MNNAATQVNHYHHPHHFHLILASSSTSFSSSTSSRRQRRRTEASTPGRAGACGRWPGRSRRTTLPILRLPSSWSTQVSLTLDRWRADHLGTITPTKFTEFSENFRMGGGVISDLKNYVANFSIKNGNFLGEKGGGVTPIRMNFVANFRASEKKRNIVFRK